MTQCKSYNEWFQLFRKVAQNTSLETDATRSTETFVAIYTATGSQNTHCHSRFFRRCEDSQFARLFSGSSSHIDFT
jgi:hypothetical protein